MANLKEFMTKDHRHCDDTFAAMEQKANSEGLAGAKELYAEMKEEMEHHFQMEERVMFPAFEEKTGMTEGPTQMRSLIKEVGEAIARDNKERFFGLTETMMIMLQQHNMKEEQMLYTMVQQHLSADADQLISMMESMVTQ
ncbi:MAG: hemerythrin domain-containing protein [Helicobacteraceae bacterium]|jgi:iron-sulfur cluster repair protein YtfE (RIC family)|nr:hemerythrin domain-containing protein [Helicobacteraceae bacterium]